ncbi:hypothetical protein GGX14DRAFT_381420 [Mycena pura]|uniref:Uncharacterized protein n=1 Tax=Mycena pura TaxID=153505 RepID=A0AAD6XYU7_9AGAR|nr:hypothetical protein GGX14DRAFT_381420 [Mycena pura]
MTRVPNSESVLILKNEDDESTSTTNIIWEELLLRLILSDHNLSVERLRYPGRYRAAAPRHLRLCRFCRGAVEDEAHALLVCTAHDGLQPLRERFLHDIMDDVGGFDHKWAADKPYEFLRFLLSSRKIVLRLAKFVADTLAVYDSHPRYIAATLYLPM